MKSNDSITPLLEQLAYKLGTTVEYLWSILIKQAYIAGIINVIFIIIMIIGIVFTIKLHRRFSRPTEPDIVKNYEQAKTTPYKDNELLFFIPLISMGIFIIALSLLIPAAITALLHPEYWALARILYLI